MLAVAVFVVSNEGETKTDRFQTRERGTKQVQETTIVELKSYFKLE